MSSILLSSTSFWSASKNCFVQLGSKLLIFPLANLDYTFFEISFLKARISQILFFSQTSKPSLYIFSSVVPFEESHCPLSHPPPKCATTVGHSSTFCENCEANHKSVSTIN